MKSSQAPGSKNVLHQRGGLVRFRPPPKSLLGAARMHPEHVPSLARSPRVWAWQFHAHGPDNPPAIHVLQGLSSASCVAGLAQNGPTPSANPEQEGEHEGSEASSFVGGVHLFRFLVTHKYTSPANTARLPRQSWQRLGRQRSEGRRCFDRSVCQ